MATVELSRFQWSGELETRAFRLNCSPSQAIIELFWPAERFRLEEMGGLATQTWDDWKLFALMPCLC